MVSLLWLVFNNGVLLQFGTIKTVTTTLPLAYKDTSYRIYLGYIGGADGCWFTTNKTISTFIQVIKYYGINSTNSDTNNYFLTLCF